MYALANTTVTILRGTGIDDQGDVMDEGAAIATGIPAFISSPSQSPFRPIVLGTDVFEPGAMMPSVTRQVQCVLPSNTDVTRDDQILDEKTGVTYAIMLSTQLGSVGGLVPDLMLTLRRVTTTQPV